MSKKFTFLEKYPITERVASISWPILVEVTLASLFGMIDMMIVGQYEGGNYPTTANVAAIGLTNTPLYFALALVQSMGVGGTALIARAYGAKEYHRMEVILKHVLILGMLLAVPLMALALIFHYPIMHGLGAEDIAIRAGQEYYYLVIIGFVFNSLTSMIASTVRGVGETKAAMRIILTANFCNIILNILLVNGLAFFPEMGIVGAGVATLFSNVLSMSLMLWYISSGKSAIKVKWNERFKLSFDTFKQVLRIGAPSAGEQIVLRTGVIIYTRIVATLGTTVMAAHQIALNIMTLSFTPGMALGIAASSLVGQSLGAKSPDLAEKYAKRASQFGLIIGLLFGATLYFLRFQIGHLYSKNLEVVELVGIPLTVMAMVSPFQMPQLTVAGALRGAGDTVFPMIASGISVLILRVSISYVFVSIFGWGLLGAWLAVLCDQVVRSFLITWRFRQGRWKTIKVQP